MLNSDFIKKLQNKPESVKIMITWVAAAIFMFLIFGFWLWSFDSRLAYQPKPEKTLQSSPAQNLPSAWSVFKSQISNIFNALGEINF